MDGYYTFKGHVFTGIRETGESEEFYRFLERIHYANPLVTHKKEVNHEELRRPNVR